MKKILSILTLTAIFSMVQVPTMAVANTDTQAQTQQTVKNMHHGMKRPDKEQMKKQFEQRLNLTEKQKEKAKKLHEKSRAEMEPVMKKIKAKHQQLQSLQQSTLSEEEKTKQINTVKAEIKALDKQARELRKKNSEEFEKILDKTQKAELEKMKSEGRAKFEKSHKARPPFQGLGTPGLFKPGMLIPQSTKD